MRQRKWKVHFFYFEDRGRGRREGGARSWMSWIWGVFCKGQGEGQVYRANDTLPLHLKQRLPGCRRSPPTGRFQHDTRSRTAALVAALLAPRDLNIYAVR